MEFKRLEKEEQLDEIASAKGALVIFKHNTTCPISQGVLKRLEAEPQNIKGTEGVYLLDLMEKRELSNAVAERFGVEHQSPQLLLIRNGQCTFHQWGYDISAEETAAATQD
jgi:bacillithiol system protein YtxJ